MGAIASISDLINRYTGGNSGTPDHRWVFKDGRIGAGVASSTAAGRLTSLWLYNGQPSHGATPGAAAVPTNATAGSIAQADPGGGRQKWLTGATVFATQPGTLILYDRLAHMGGLSAAVTTAQTVNCVPTRYTGAEAAGNQIWAEVYTQIGPTATTLTASYTDQGGAAGNTTQATAIGGSGLAEPQRIIPLSLASGDTGVQSVQSVTLAASTGGAGSFGITVARPLLYLPIPVQSLCCVRDLIRDLPGIVEVKPGACLAWAWLPTGTSPPQVFGSLHMVEA